MAQIHVKNLQKADTGITVEPIREPVTYDLLTLPSMVPSGHTDRSRHEKDQQLSNKFNSKSTRQRYPEILQ
ncbi:MAG: hypothetical protein KC592_17740 [Nitrospira sp.]|nr:hypothetical protein [Nitrospira sp.]